MSGTFFAPTRIPCLQGFFLLRLRCTHLHHCATSLCSHRYAILSNAEQKALYDARLQQKTEGETGMPNAFQNARELFRCVLCSPCVPSHPSCGLSISTYHTCMRCGPFVPASSILHSPLTGFLPPSHTNPDLSTPSPSLSTIFYHVVPSSLFGNTAHFCPLRLSDTQGSIWRRPVWRRRRQVCGYRPGGG